MKDNKLSIVIKKPVSEVFSYTLNPKNTHLWIDDIEKEVAEEWPPKIGTNYSNRSKGDKRWSHYKLVESIENKTFTLKRTDGDYYFVKYSFASAKDNSTRFEYHEWAENTDLDSPFSKRHLDKLKSILEEQ